MTQEGLIVAGFIYLGLAIFTGLYILAGELKQFARVVAHLPTALEQKKNVVLAPYEEAREGDIKFHFPTSMLPKDD